MKNEILMLSLCGLIVACTLVFVVVLFGAEEKAQAYREEAALCLETKERVEACSCVEAVWLRSGGNMVIAEALKRTCGR